MDILILMVIITIAALLYFLIQNLVSLYFVKHPKEDTFNPYNAYENYEPRYQNIPLEEEPSVSDYMECFYVLGFSEIPTENELKRRYRELAKENHPDRGGSQEKFEKINKAYSDAQKILNMKN